MRKDLLIKGAEVLEADAVNPEGIKFNLSTWASDARIDLATAYSDPSTRQYYYKDAEVVPVNCGTQACAMGLFAISETFKDEGLSYETVGGKLRPILKQGILTYRDWEAVTHLFDINTSDSWRLFSSEYYDRRTGAPAEMEVAARMRHLATTGSFD